MMNLKGIMRLLILTLGLTSCDEQEFVGDYEVIKLDGRDIEDQGVTININNENGYRIGGNNGCNTYGADLELSGGNNVKVGPAMATKMFCQDKAKIEQAFMSQLEKVSAYDFSQGKLNLLDKDGNTLMVAQRTKDKE